MSRSKDQTGMGVLPSGDYLMAEDMIFSAAGEMECLIAKVISATFAAIKRALVAIGGWHGSIASRERSLRKINLSSS
jgi:hypothetical protein